MHLHDPALFLSVQIALNPQGEGLQGSGLSVDILGGPMNINLITIFFQFNLRVVILWHAMNALPVYPGSHWHTAL